MLGKILFNILKLLTFIKFIAWKGKVMEFIPYCAEEAFQFCFYQIPKELFTNDYYKKNLSSDAILLYALLLDRLSISRKRGWIDENGHIFLIFTRKHAEEMLNISDKTATKAFRQLKEVKLIDEKRLGKGKTYRIYVGKINRKKYDSSTGNFTTDPSEKVRHSKNNNSYNKNSKKTRANFEQREYDDLSFVYANNNWSKMS